MTTDLDDMFGEEELHEDLKPYLHEHGKLGHVLQHPLVYSVPHYLPLNKHINGLYARKLEVIEEARKGKDWGRILSLYEKPYRLDALLDLAHEITDRRAYWRHVCQTWITTELIHLQYDKWLEIWSEPNRLSASLNRIPAMTAGERKLLASLPPRIEVWRGAGRKGWAIGGMSWCLDRPTAEWFAWRYSEGRDVPHCAHGFVDRNDVYALLLGRGEFEVVVDPDNVELEDVYKAPRTIERPAPLVEFVV